MVPVTPVHTEDGVASIRLVGVNISKLLFAPGVFAKGTWLPSPKVPPPPYERRVFGTYREEDDSYSWQ
jgi:hypothetical protein